jgi:hypothetical protein
MKSMEEKDLYKYMRENPTKFCECQFKFEEDIEEYGSDGWGSYRAKYNKNEIKCMFLNMGAKCAFELIEINDKNIKLKCHGLGKELIVEYEVIQN